MHVTRRRCNLDAMVMSPSPRLWMMKIETVTSLWTHHARCRYSSHAATSLELAIREQSMRPRESSVTERTEGTEMLRCPMCESAELVIRQCKAICELCGYVESCEDNFLSTSSNPVGAR